MGNNRIGMETPELAESVKRWNAKLSKRTVNQIRRLIGKKPQHEIAKDFNVSQSTISMIFKRRIWI